MIAIKMATSLNGDSVEKEAIEEPGEIEATGEEEADIEIEGTANEGNAGRGATEEAEATGGVGEEETGREGEIGKERKVREKGKGRMWIRILGSHLVTKRRSSRRSSKRNRVRLR